MDNNDLSPPCSQETFNALMSELQPNNGNFLELLSSTPPNLQILEPLEQDPNLIYELPNNPFVQQRSQGPANEDVNYVSASHLPAPVTSTRRSFGETPILATVPEELNNDRGEYGFDLSFECSDDPAKSVSWTYSSELDQLYTKISVPCPVKFHFERSPRFGSSIRSVMYFKKPEAMQYPVERCIRHQMGDSDLGDPLSKHILRCQDSSATHYEADSRTHILMPIKMPLGYIKSTVVNYSLHCRTSCVGGMNRKPVFILFTLEHNGAILGKRFLDVRICACPGRDRHTDENKKTTRTPRLTLQTDLEPRPSSQGCSYEKKEDPPLIVDLKRIVFSGSSAPSTTGRKKIKKGNDTYTVEVQGYENYRIMMRFRRLLEDRALTNKLLKCFRLNQDSSESSDH